ncbi:MAG: site-specific DNA-methyltransferase [Deltaproteobacteria bacterium]|nr:site-specific DNA-methyltransferase [Deltaproteobacteria bacterium]
MRNAAVRAQPGLFGWSTPGPAPANLRGGIAAGVPPGSVPLPTAAEPVVAEPVVVDPAVGLAPAFALDAELSRPLPGSPTCDLIESENLVALRRLLPTLRGRVAAIYIDPPYNTGSLGFAYADRTTGRGAAERHSSWVAFMRERLTVARDLLCDDGVLFVSIDDNEQPRLRLLCDQVFGEDAFVAQFIWHKTRKGKALCRTARLVTEYVVCYTRDRDLLTKRGLWGSAADAELPNPFFHRPNRPRDIVFPPGSIETNMASGDYAAGVYGDPEDSLSVRVLAPFSVRGGRISTTLQLHGRFRWQQSTLDEELTGGMRFSLRKGKFRIVFFRSDGHKAPPTLLDDRSGIGTYEEASAEVEALLGWLPFVYPKPVSLVQYLVRAATWDRKDAIVVDFFAGTGTTGHAVAALNAEDRGRRRCILVTDNSGKVGEGFVADAGADGICRGTARRRLAAAFGGGDAGRPVLPTALAYWRPA